MPTTTDKLNDIREKCIANNPAIRERQSRCMTCGYGFEFCTCTPKRTEWYLDREIGLADVLLAIKKRDDQGLTPTILGDIFWEEESSVAWNLLKPLHEQEEPTINFIWEILK